MAPPLGRAASQQESLEAAPTRLPHNGSCRLLWPIAVAAHCQAPVTSCYKPKIPARTQRKTAMARLLCTLLSVLALGVAALAQQTVPVSSGQEGTLDQCQVSCHQQNPRALLRTLRRGLCVLEACARLARVLRGV